MRNRLLVLIAVLVGLFALGSQVRFTTDVQALLPSEGALRRTLSQAQEFDSSAVILIAIDGSTVEREELVSAAEALTEELLALEDIERVRSGFTLEDGVAIREQMRPYTASFVPPAILAERTSADGVLATLESQRQKLLGPGGVFYANAIKADPLDLDRIALDTLRDAAQPGVHVADGILVDTTGTHALLLATPVSATNEIRPDDPRIAELEALLARQALPTTWYGGHRIAYDTASTIRRDASLTAGLGMVLLAGVLVLGFRSWRPVVGAAGPAAVAAACSGAGAWFASPVHGIQIGFGAALAGLAVDYWVHLYLAAAAQPDQHDLASRYRAALRALKELLPALTVSAGSTALAFALLTTSSLPIVRVLGIVGASAAGGALLGTVLAGPLVWAVVGRPTVPAGPWAPRRGVGTAVAIGAVVLGLLGISGRFDPDPMALIAQSEGLTQAERSLSDRFGLDTQRALLLLEGDSAGALLDQSARIQEAVGALGFTHASGPGGLIPGPEALAESRAILPSAEVLQQRLDAATEVLELPPFPGEGARLAASLHSVPLDVWDGTALQDRVNAHLREVGDGAQVLLSIPLRDATVAPAVVDEVWSVAPDVAVVIPTGLAAAGMDSARQALISRAALGGLAVLVLLTLRHRSLPTALAALLPAFTAVAAAAGAVWLSGTPWNPVSLAAMVPVLGLAVDYGVFMVEHGKGTAPRAVMLSAVTTLAGFSTLALAKSPALFGVGVATFAGVAMAAAVALWVVPLLNTDWPGVRVRKTAFAIAVAFLVGAHLDLLLVVSGAYTPPEVPDPPQHELVVEAPERRFGDTVLKRDSGVWLLSTQGGDFEAGWGAGKVLAPLHPRLEAELFEAFHTLTPNGIARYIITRGSIVVGSTLDAHIDPGHRVEIRATDQALGDPYWFAGSSYTRKVYYHAIHDLGQALVDSPLLACTGFIAGPGATTNGSWILGRNFDFEGGVGFDRDKVVRIHRPEHGIPFLSIAFAGMTGAVSGVNDEGLAVAINASGSDDPPRPGTPMTLIVREILQTCSDLPCAEDILARRTGFVSENVMVVDADGGEAALFEVSPQRVETIQVDGWLAIANHFRSPVFAEDETNRERQAEATTGARQARMEELVGRASGRIDLSVASEILRDRNAVGDKPLARGHRHAMNADIATHGVVIDATTRTVWISRFPNLSAGFVEVKLRDVLNGTLEAEEVVPAEPEAWRALDMRRGRRVLRKARRSGSTAALALTEEAMSLMPGHPEALYERGRVLHEAGRVGEARLLLEQALAGPPEYAYQARAIRELLQ